MLQLKISRTTQMTLLAAILGPPCAYTPRHLARSEAILSGLKAVRGQISNGTELTTHNMTDKSLPTYWTEFQ